jgi:hypothetical protein
VRALGRREPSEARQPAKLISKVCRQR